MLGKNKKKNYFLNQQLFISKFQKTQQKEGILTFFVGHEEIKKIRFLMLGFAMKQAVKKEKNNKF